MMKRFAMALAVMAAAGCGDDGADGPTESDAIAAAQKVNEGKNGAGAEACHICVTQEFYESRPCTGAAYWEPAQVDGEWTTAPVQVDYQNDRDQYCDENDEWIPQ